MQIRPAFGGNIMAQIVTTNTRPQFATVRYKVMDAPMREESAAGEIVHCKLPKGVGESQVKHVRTEPVPAGKTISDADILVVGGRGLQKEADLKLIREAARFLGGDWAITRPLAEKGWCTNDRQIGLSGRTVRPKLIITCGGQRRHPVRGLHEPVRAYYRHQHRSRRADLPGVARCDRRRPVRGIAGAAPQTEGGKRMKPFQKINDTDLAVFEKLMPGRVFYGSAISEDYDHDEMTEYGHYMPDAVLQALSTEEVCAVLAYCNSHNIAVTPRGTGTGLCGGCVARDGGIVLSTEKMKKVLEVDTQNMTATVEPGVLLMEFPKALEGTGLFYPPDPGEKTATMGGNAMTNAGGMRAVRYGVTRDYVLGMEVVLADGTVLSLGGKNVKTSSGYSLIQLMVGSEGTLGFLTKLTVKLIPEPKVNLSLLIPFDDLNKCIGAVPAVLACGCEPTAVEFMERAVIASAETYLGKQFPDTSADAYLLVRLDGASTDALQPSVAVLTDLALSLGAKDVLLADTDERKESIWNARGAFLEAIKSGTPSMDECDVVVPRDKIALFVEKSIAIGKRQGVRICSFGHAGDGNLHIYACQDNLTEDLWQEKVHCIMDELYAEARALSGEVSGEHGVGHAKRAFLEESLGSRQIELMRGIKQVFDPNGILNPGKVV